MVRMVLRMGQFGPGTCNTPVHYWDILGFSQDFPMIKDGITQTWDLRHIHCDPGTSWGFPSKAHKLGQFGPGTHGTSHVFFGHLRGFPGWPLD